MAKGFVKGVKNELKKVVWPTKEQLIKTTGMVILLVVAFSVIIQFILSYFLLKIHFKVKENIFIKMVRNILGIF